MATKITPLGDRVIVKPQSAEEVTSFGLVLSDAGKEKPMQGSIVAVSNTAKDKTLKAGDLVLFKKYSPTEFKLDDNEELYVLDIEDILAKIES
jgi:chaperonin GroES